ncbi:hypothetical protein BKA63DRAFT_562510 [Paraphoma chrysanthemicola]|nr:hypothetical protein BKA63DRAFT_562510 [Paraphoma chrysanthemicola]
MTSTTFHTLYAPYHTAQAAEAAEHSDMIPSRSSGRTLVAVHPVPATWLRKNLPREEQRDILNHINAVIANRGASSAAFIQVVRLTQDQLEALGDGESHSTIPGRAPAPSPRNITGADSVTTSQLYRKSGWNANNPSLDAIEEDFGRMSIAPSQHTPSHPTRHHLGLSRATSYAGNAQDVGQGDRPPYINPLSASSPFNNKRGHLFT